MGRVHARGGDDPNLERAVELANRRHRRRQPRRPSIHSQSYRPQPPEHHSHSQYQRRRSAPTLDYPDPLARELFVDSDSMILNEISEGQHPQLPQPHPERPTAVTT